MKYLILNTPHGEVPILFGGSLIHRWVWESLGGLGVVGAGFVRLENGEPTCFGRSDSLNIASRGAIDAALITKNLMAPAKKP
ncbi:MAG: hypothetical protein ACPGO3_11795 [Magnetospiraceae bacterium]